MAALAGLLCGLGLFLIWTTFWVQETAPASAARPNKINELLQQAGLGQVTPWSLTLSTLALATLIGIVVLALTGAPPVALCFALFGAYLPFALLHWRARRRSEVLRQLWPDVVDHLRSAIRAGLSLPEALIQLGTKGPAELRPEFIRFASDYRASGQFDASLERLKNSLADPVADRIIEALRLTRDVGGSDLGKLLGTLSDFLRDHARTRSELEARQSWTVNAARLAVAAPWIVLMLMASRPEAIAAYSSPMGWAVLGGGLLVSVLCYRLMLRIGQLPQEERVLR